MSPDDRNVRRHRILLGALGSKMCDSMTAREIRALVLAVDRALDNDGADDLAPDPSVWPDECLDGGAP